jgi:hypothetical protein
VGIKRSFEWRLAAPPVEAASLLRAALERMEAKVDARGDTEFTAETRRSIRKNRWAAKWNVAVDEDDAGTKVDIEIDLLGDKHPALLAELEKEIGDLRVVNEAADEQTARIEELAKKKLSIKFFVRREVKKLPALLDEGEQVVNLGQGTYDGRQGLVVVTNRRILFSEEGIVRSRLEDFPYDRISSVQTSTGFTAGEIRIFASGNKAEIKDVMPKERVPEIADYVRARLQRKDEPSTVATPRQASAEPDPLDQLKKLGELRDAGVLTADEFEAKKASILERL